MRRLYFALIALALMGLSALTSCRDNDDAEQGLTTMDDDMMSLTVIFSQSGPGDNGYNDLMTEGTVPFADSMHIALHTLRPITTLEAKMMLDQWLEDTKDREQRSLLVLAGSDYEELAAGLSPLGDGKRSVLLLESESESMPEGVSTANIDRKSVFYLAGAMSARTDAYIMAGMRGDKMVDAAIKAFRDGFEKHNERNVIEDVLYISDEDDVFPEWGYNNPDKAYRMAREILAERKKLCEQTKTILDSRFILLPLAGASNYGAYMLAMEEDINSKTPMGIIGMDKDHNGQMDLLPFSVVLRVDRMLYNCLSAWSRGEALPKHRTFTMPEGYADVVVNPTFDTRTYFAYEIDRDAWYIDDETGDTIFSAKRMDENYWNEKYQALKKEAVEYR